MCVCVCVCLCECALCVRVWERGYKCMFSREPHHCPLHCVFADNQYLCVYMCMRLFMLRVCMCMCVCVCMHVSILVREMMCVDVCVCLYVCVSGRAHACTCVHVPTCALCMHVYMCV